MTPLYSGAHDCTTTSPVSGSTVRLERFHILEAVGVDDDQRSKACGAPHEIMIGIPNDQTQAPFLFQDPKVSGKVSATPANHE
jgi:hypothetical protein